MSLTNPAYRIVLELRHPAPAVSAVQVHDRIMLLQGAIEASDRHTSRTNAVKYLEAASKTFKRPRGSGDSLPDVSRPAELFGLRKYLLYG